MNKLNKIIEFSRKNKVYIICVALILLSIISIIIQKIDRESIVSINDKNISSKDNKIAVYLSGEVKNPGVYYISADERLDRLIDLAGGITEKADINKLNLAQKLNDGDKVVVWAKNINDETQNETNTDNKDDETKIETKDCIDINNASKEELMSLSGIGESTADKIITYRKKNEFENIEDIKNVSGIGDAKFNAIKEDICVD